MKPRSLKVKENKMCVYIKDGRQAAILNDINNLFDVHNPQTIPDLGVKHGRMDVRTDVDQIISPQTLRVGG